MFDRHAIEESQAQLLRRIAARDKAALTELYDQMSAAIYSVALRMLGSAHDAEEIVQETFVQIWERAGLFDSKLGSGLSWALGIARNRCIDWIRAHRRRARMIEDVGEEMKAAVVEDMDALAGLSVEELGNVRSAVRGLPADQRQAIELAFFGGLTHQEIAEQLLEPLGTVKARIRRGMLKLRDALQPYL
ncbi:MAG: sigma-70 family RNA polymerase sigma factor [Gammaproteobacteria bacterium]